MDNEQTKRMDEILAARKAPSQGGKPIWAKDIELASALIGTKDPRAIFGKAIPDHDEKAYSVPLNFGCKNQTGLLDNNTRARLLAFKKALSNWQIQAQIKGRSDQPTIAVYESLPIYKHVIRPTMKAFDIASWQEWIPTLQARFYFEEYEIPLLIAGLFDDMTMPGSIVRIPGALGLLEGQLETDDATFDAQSNSEASYTVEAKNNVVHTVITQDLLDDSAPPMIDKLRKEVVRGVARAYERAILDGDESGAHFDADYQAGSAKLFVKAFNGLRERAFANETLTGGTGQIVYDHLDDNPSKDLFSEVMKRLKCQGSEKNDLHFIMGCSTSHDLVTGAIPELFTAFAFGGLASNVTGQVPPVFGVQSVESSYVREDLAATGVYTIAGNTQTYLMCVQKSRFMTWTRQATKVWAAPSLPSSDKMLMSGKARHSFAGIPQTATERSVTMGINIKTV